MNSVFTTGEKQDIAAILNSKDERAAFQRKLLSDYPDQAILAIKLNVPGPIKNNSALLKLFERGFTRLVTELQRHFTTVELVAKWQKSTGNEAFLIVNGDPTMVKKWAVDFEDHDQIGRLFDVDVFGNGNPIAISRSDFNFPTRRCFICGRSAKVCARSRRHSITTLQTFIQQQFDKEFSTNNEVNDANAK